MRKPGLAILQILIILLIVVLFIILFVSFSFALPVGITISSNTTENGSTLSPGQSSAEGGTITTLLVNVSAQTTSWKGYVGNVTGRIALKDSSNYSLYDWVLSSVAGEVYASRSSTIVWQNVNCSNSSLLTSEDAFLGMPLANIDTINKTFNGTIHKTFVVGSRSITNSTCPSIALNINNTAQSPSEQASFQEIALYDGSSNVYSATIENNLYGFDNQTYDFQMIVPDSYAETTATTYYFWVELS
jgi:hypothetical protein